MISSTLRRCSSSSRRAPVSQYSDPGDEVVLQQMMPPDHDVVEHAHVVEQREVLEGAADAEARPGVGIERR